MAFCANCGSQLADNAAFCPACGKAAGQVSSGPEEAPHASSTASQDSSGATSLPLSENVAGMLAYFTIIPAIVFLVIEPYNRNRFVRFHAFQCIFVVVALIILSVALTIFHWIPVLGWVVVALVWPLSSLAVFALWLLLVIKAYQHEIYKLPFVGDLAEKQADA